MIRSRAPPRRFSAVLLGALLVLSGLILLIPTATAADYWIKVDMGRPYGGQIGSGLWGIDVGDGDRDGRTEVYVSCNQNGIIYRFNCTNDTWSSTEVGPIARANEAQAFALAIGDGDDDGKLDIYVSGRYRDQFWQAWVNRMFQFYHNGTTWNRVDMGGAGGEYITGIAIGDGNNDSRKEVFCSNRDGHMYMYTKGNDWNTQDMGNATRYYRNNQWNTPIMRDVAVGDGDNDGYPEVYGAASDQQVYQFKYTGNSWAVKEMGRGEDDGTDNAWSQGMYAVAVGDPDGDGRNEVYSASYINATIYRYNYNKNTTKWDIQKLVSLGGSINALTLTIGDANMDGKDELYAGCSNNQVYQILYDSVGAKWVSSSVGSGDGAIRGVAVGSATGDPSLTEVYAASADGHAYQFYADKVPPPNPIVWSDTHPETSKWYTNATVRVLWKDGGKDISGIDGYSYLWDTKPLTIPDDIKDSEESVSSYTTTLPDGIWYFHIKARDNALNWNKSASHYGPIWIDTTPPESVKVSINDGADYTNEKIVSLSLSATDPSPGSGVAWLAISNDGSAWTGWEVWTGSLSGWDLTNSAYGGTNTDGVKWVYVKAKDAAGNEMPSERKGSDSIFLDRVAPQELSIVINGDTEFATSANVSLKLGATDPSPASGLWKMSLSNDGISWSDWVDWSGECSWSLTSGAGGSEADGDRTVSLRVMDRAGNIGGPVRDSIFLDRRPPEGLSIVINDGREYTNSSSVSLAIYATDPTPSSQLSEMALANEEGALINWEFFSTSKDGWSLTSGPGGIDADGEKGVYLKVRDRAGNVAGPVKDTIFLDRVSPVNLSVTINDGASYTTSPVITLSLRATDPAPASGTYAMRFSEDLSAWTDWEAFSTIRSFTLSPGDGTKTVYFMVRDKAGNEAGPVYDSIVLDTHPPVISSVSVSGITDSSAIVSWVTDEEADSRVEFGTTTSYSSSAGDDSYVIAHSVTLQGLSPGTTYHFRVRSMDRAGNPPSYSEDYIFITAPAPDKFPPVITSVSVSGITDRIAIVSWVTNEPADSVVLYGRDTSYGLRAGDPAFVLKHIVTLTDLQPSTTYHFIVQSTDTSGNGPSTSEDMTFTTLAEPDTKPPIISGVKVGGITDNVAVVSWETDEPADSAVEYGTTTAYGQSVRDASLLQLHSIVLRNLLPSTTYHFRVSSTDATGNGPSFSEDLTFTTLAEPDTRAPVILNVRVEGVTESSATIIWETDELADAVVEYGKTTAYGLYASVPDYTLQHSVLLLKLEPDTTYHFRVRSRDPSGNSKTGEDMSFRTRKSSPGPDKVPPVISELVVAGVSDTRAVVMWRTDEPASGEVEYGTTTAYGLRMSEAAFGIIHSVLLDGLQPSTEYHLRVRCFDVYGNGPSLSPDITFTTGSKPDTTPPVITGVQVVNITDSSATIIWNTDEPSTSSVEFGTDLFYGRNVSSMMMVLNHSIHLTGLSPGTTYRFRVVSVDPAGNIARSIADLNFTTLKGPGPLPSPNPRAVRSEFPWMLVVLAVAFILLLAASVAIFHRQRPRPGVPSGPATEEPEVEVLEMEDRGAEAPAPKDSISKSAASTPEVGGGARQGEIRAAGAAEARSAEVGAIPVGPQRSQPMEAPVREPVKHIRCPVCRTRIPLYHDGPQEVVCPICGRRGPYKPGGAGRGTQGTQQGGGGETIPGAAQAGTQGAPGQQTPPAGEAPAPVKTIRCSACGARVPIYTSTYPVKITCPGCGRSGLYKGPRAT
ncbi:MAG: fibronectin type III domain-containing protein [Thermoplasmata archaeon]